MCILCGGSGSITHPVVVSAQKVCPMCELQAEVKRLRTIVAHTDQSLIDTIAERDMFRATLEDVLAAILCSPQNPWKNCKAQEYSNHEHYDSHIHEVEVIIAKALASAKDGE